MRQGRVFPQREESTQKLGGVVGAGIREALSEVVVCYRVCGGHMGGWGGEGGYSR